MAKDNTPVDPNGPMLHMRRPSTGSLRPLNLNIVPLQPVQLIKGLGEQKAASLEEVDTAENEGAEDLVKDDVKKSSWLEACDILKGEKKGSQPPSGPGSRGGTIVGYTKSGKPIYMKHTHTSHDEFSKQDHKDASKLHEQLSKQHKDGLAKEYHKQVADFHRQLSQAESSGKIKSAVNISRESYQAAKKAHKK